MGAKFTYEQVQLEFIEKGYILLSKEYVGCFEKLEALCPIGHSMSVSFNNFRNHNVKCPTCSKKKKPTFEEVLRVFNQNGYTLLTQNYKNCDQKLETLCPSGHPHSISFYHFSIRKQRCAICSGTQKYSLEDVRKIVESEGYSLLSTEYKGVFFNIDLMCSKGHSYSPSFHSFKTNNSRCPICGLNGVSKGELELSNIIRGVYPDVKKKRDGKVKIENKPHIKGFEIDIYIPALKKGIEYDGKYYHSFERMRADPDKALWSDDDIRNYHKFKDDWFLSLGIKILHIKEEEWDLDKESCIKRCLDFLAS